MEKIGRNERCPCGSGRKYKKCHGNPLNPQPLPAANVIPEEIQLAIRRHEAQELIRTQQQGLGRPIISTDHASYRVIAVGNKIRYSKKWKYFADFLSDYLKEILDPEWGNAEIKKPLADRHPILQLYDSYCTFQRSVEARPDGTRTAIATGVVHCYLGLAYNLYLLDHNAELQERLITHLKDPKNFQGAYYELIIANCLIRAGFELALEDERDESEKHCEFSATSKKTGKKYWVEAKMRGVAGLLGKTKVDGATQTAKPTSRLTAHLNDALQKPADEARLIFIDVNAPMENDQESNTDTQELPVWMEAAIRQLDDKEKDLREGQAAYVFVTNFPYHRHLNAEAPPPAVLAYGLGIPDFSKPGERRLPEMWRRKQKHIDAHEIVSSMSAYPRIPTTFDGSLPLTEMDAKNRIMIGERYFFEDIGEKGVLGEVTSATVSVEEKKMYIGVSIEGENSQIWSRDLNDDEIDTYKLHGDAYFGEVRPVGGRNDDPYELFEWFLDCYKDTPRERLLEFCKDHPNFEVMAKLDDTELCLAICEAWTVSAVMSAKKRKAE